MNKNAPETKEKAPVKKELISYSKQGSLSAFTV